MREEEKRKRKEKREVKEEELRKRTKKIRMESLMKGAVVGEGKRQKKR